RYQPARLPTCTHVRTVLGSIDGRAPTPQVGSAIDQVLRTALARKPPAERRPKTAGKPRASKPAKPRGSSAPSTAGAKKPAREASKTKAKAAKSGGQKRAGRKAAARKSS